MAMTLEEALSEATPLSTCSMSAASGVSHSIATSCRPRWESCGSGSNVALTGGTFP
jgi:hypothetical protein